MLSAYFMILFAIFLLNPTISDAEFLIVDCKDNELNTYCQCAYDEKQDYFIMNSKSTHDFLSERKKIFKHC